MAAVSIKGSIFRVVYFSFIVSSAAVIRVVTQRFSPEKHCVTTPITAAEKGLRLYRLFDFRLAGYLRGAIDLHREHNAKRDKNDNFFEHREPKKLYPIPPRHLKEYPPGRVDWFDIQEKKMCTQLFFKPSR